MRGRVDVEFAARGAINVELETYELFIEAARDLAQERAIHEHTRGLHVDEHRNQRDFDLFKQADQVMRFDIGPEHFFQPQHHLRLRRRHARGLGDRQLGECPLARDLLRCQEVEAEPLARQVNERVRSIAGVEDETRDHRIVDDATESSSAARERNP